MLFPTWSVSIIAIFLSSTAAFPSTLHQDASLLLEERGTTTVMTAALLAKMKFFVQYSAAAYCNAKASSVGTKISCSNSGCPSVEAASAQNYAFIGYPDTQSQGFVAIDSTNKLIVVSFEGSRTWENWLIDTIVATEPCDLVSGCSLHAGFKLAWEDIQSIAMSAVKTAKAANPSYSVVTTGHSLGGALATLACAYFRVAGIPCDIYSYGSPRVGNTAFSNFVNDQAGSHYRVTHTNDPVPNVPTSWVGYRHSGTEFWLSTGSSTTTAYEVGDVVVCAGVNNNDCVGSSWSVDLIAHQTYFQNVQACL